MNFSFGSPPILHVSLGWGLVFTPGLGPGDSWRLLEATPATALAQILSRLDVGLVETSSPEMVRSSGEFPMKWHRASGHFSLFYPIRSYVKFLEGRVLNSGDVCSAAAMLRMGLVTLVTLVKPCIKIWDYDYAAVTWCFRNSNKELTDIASEKRWLNPTKLKYFGGIETINLSPTV